MKTDKMIESFAERIREVFSDELEKIGWNLKSVEIVEDSGKAIRQTCYHFCDADESRTLHMTVDQSVKVPAFELDTGKNAVQEYLVIKDASAIKKNNVEVLSRLSDEEKAIFDRISRYIELKIEEFVY